MKMQTKPSRAASLPKASTALHGSKPPAKASQASEGYTLSIRAYQEFSYCKSLFCDEKAIMELVVRKKFLL